MDANGIAWTSRRGLTAHDLAADGSWENAFNFRVGVRGRIIFTLATYSGVSVKIGTIHQGHAVIRYVDPENRVFLVLKDSNQ